MKHLKSLVNRFSSVHTNVIRIFQSQNICNVLLSIVKFANDEIHRLHRQQCHE